MQRGAAVIAGIGHTTYGAHEGRSTVSLNVEAIRKRWPMRTSRRTPSTRSS
jgi:hypothetical protein